LQREATEITEPQAYTVYTAEDDRLIGKVGKLIQQMIEAFVSIVQKPIIAIV